MQKFTLTVSCPTSGLIASITHDIASSNGIYQSCTTYSVDIDTFFCKVDFTPVNGFSLESFEENFKSLQKNMK